MQPTMKNIISWAVMLLLPLSVFSQSVIVEGYAYETGNRGYLNEVIVKAYHPVDGLIATTSSNRDGNYTMTLPIARGITLIATKDLFHETEHSLDLLGKSDGDKVFVKTEMQRAPGYIFEITLANKKLDNEVPVDAIKGAHIEVYNNTTKKEILNLKDHMDPDFKINLLKGNHYTLLIRKEGYLSKRLEAFVDVKDCILCFEGIGDVRPDVADNLTGGNSNGTLLANVELDPLFVGKKIELEKIYYDLAKWDIRPDAAEELDKVGVFLKDNPRLNVELGSHTDSRGKAAYNMDLSQKRAESALRYLRTNSGVRKNRTSFKGYGETQLVNQCADGVKCTDEEHQQNRRTELKVLGVQAPEEYKSLLRMKTDADMEAMVLALSDEDQIRVPAGGELPDELKKAIAKEEAAKTKALEMANQKEKKAIESKQTVIVKEKELTKEMPSVEKPTIDTKISTETVEKKVESVKTEMKATSGSTITKISEKNIEDQVAIETAKLDKKLDEETKATTPIDPAINEAAKVKEQAKKLAIQKAAMEAEKAKLKELEEQKSQELSAINNKSTDAINTTQATAGNTTSPINTSLNGHKIVIHYANLELPADHKIYKKHSSVEMYKEKDFYYYLIGSYDSEKEATKFMKLYVQREYPNAYVMNFKNGVRLK